MKKVLLFLIFPLALAWNTSVIYESTKIPYDLLEYEYIQGDTIILPYNDIKNGQGSFYIIDIKNDTIELSNEVQRAPGDNLPIVVCFLKKCVILLYNAGGYGGTNTFHKEGGGTLYEISNNKLLLKKVLNSDFLIDYKKPPIIQSNGIITLMGKQENNIKHIYLFRNGKLLKEVTIPFCENCSVYFINETDYYYFKTNRNTTAIITHGNTEIGKIRGKIEPSKSCYPEGNILWCAFNDNGFNIIITKISSENITVTGIVNFGGIPLASEVLFFGKKNDICELIIQDGLGRAKEYVSKNCTTWVEQKIPNYDYLGFWIDGNSLYGYAKNRIGENDMTQVLLVSKTLELMPDLYIEPKYLNLKIKTNEHIFIPTRVYNLGNLEIKNISIVCKFDNNTYEKNIESLKPDDFITTDIEVYFSTPGVSEIICEIDPENKIKELDETNNKAKISVVVICNESKDCLPGYYCFNESCIKCTSCEVEECYKYLQCGKKVSQNKTQPEVIKEKTEKQETNWIFIILPVSVILIILIYWIKKGSKNY